MWLFDRVSEIVNYYNYNCDETVDAFLQKQYFGLFFASGIYLKFIKNHWFLSVIQILFINIVLIFFYCSLMWPAFSLSHINIVLFSQNVHFCLLIQLVFCVVNTIQSKRDRILKIYINITTTFFDYKEPYLGILNKLKGEMYQERKLWVILPLLVGMAAGIILTLGPIIDRYGGTFDFTKISTLVNDDLPIAFAKYPFSTRDSIGKYFGVMSQLALCFVLSSVIGTGGFSYIIMSQHLALEMRVLLDSMENIDLRVQLIDELMVKSKSISKGRTINIYSMCLRRNLQHHQNIMRYFKYWTDVYSLPVFLSYMTGTIVIALSLLSTGSWVELPGTTIASMVLCAAEVGYMYLFSYFSQLITDLNEELHLKIYEIKWYTYDESIKRSIRIFQVRTLRPMTLVAGGLVPANMETFAKVMNSAYSYYNLVNAFNVISDKPS